jgi:hypothetical protein
MLYRFWGLLDSCLAAEGVEVQWYGYVKLNIIVLMESKLLCEVHLLRGDGEVHFTRFHPHNALIRFA